MKQKYFSTLLLSLLFGITNAQNNALQMSNDSFFSCYNVNNLNYSDYYLNESSFTIEYDFYLNALTNFNARISSLADSGLYAKPIHFYVNDTGASILSLGNGYSEEVIPGMPTFNVQQWYHIALVVTNDAAKNVKVYVNGIPMVDYNFTTTLEGFYNQNRLNLGANSSYSWTNVGNAKYDNFRIWSTARTASEIANNYTSCVARNEPGLVSYFNFDGFNGNQIENLATNSLNYNLFYVYNSYSYVTGSGCSITPLQAPIYVSGGFNAIFYYVDQVNGKPHYKTDNYYCATNITPATCSGAASPFSEIVWENNQWKMRSAYCVMSLGEECVPAEFNSIDDNIIGINSNDTPLPPCTGWTNNLTITTSDCTTLATVSQKLEDHITIYPNPTHTILNIEVKEEVTIQVFDVMGKMILFRNNVLNSERINLTNYPNGVYLVKVTDATGNNKSYKIIKE